MVWIGGDDALCRSFGCAVEGDGRRRVRFAIGRVLSIEQDIGGEMDEAGADLRRGRHDRARPIHDGGLRFLRSAPGGCGVDDRGRTQIGDQSGDAGRIPQVKRRPGAAGERRLSPVICPDDDAVGPDSRIEGCLADVATGTGNEDRV